MPSPSIEDRFGISYLFVRYTCALDAGGDAEAVIDCIAQDGTLVSPAVGEHTGRAAITAFAQRFARFQAGGSQLRHVISNLMMTVDGDRAQATCNLTVFITKDGKSKLMAPGRYDCELRKIAGHWRFQLRVVLQTMITRWKVSEGRHSPRRPYPSTPESQQLRPRMRAQPDSRGRRIRGPAQSEQFR